MNAVKDLVSHVNSLTWTWPQVFVMMLFLVALAIGIWATAKLIALPFRLRAALQRAALHEEAIKDSRASMNQLMASWEQRSLAAEKRLQELELGQGRLGNLKTQVAAFAPFASDAFPLLKTLIEQHSGKFAALEARLAPFARLEEALGTSLVARLGEIPEPVARALKEARDEALGHAVKAFGEQHVKDLVEVAKRTLAALEPELGKPEELTADVRARLKTLLEDALVKEAEARAAIARRAATMPEEQLAELDPGIIDVAKFLLGFDRDEIDDATCDTVRDVLREYIRTNGQQIMINGENEVDPEVVAVATGQLGKGDSDIDSEVGQEVKKATLGYVVKYGDDILKASEDEVDAEVVATAKGLFGDENNAADDDVLAAVTRTTVTYVHDEGKDALDDADTEVDAEIVGLAKVLFGDENNDADAEISEAVKLVTGTYIHDEGKDALDDADTEVDPEIVEAAKGLIREAVSDASSPLRPALTKVARARIAETE
jgi:hypothetical protein